MKELQRSPKKRAQERKPRRSPKKKTFLRRPKYVFYSLFLMPLFLPSTRFAQYSTCSFPFLSRLIFALEGLRHISHASAPPSPLSSLSLYSSNTVACRLLKEHSVEGIPYSYLDGHEPEKRRTDGRTEDVSLFSDPISAVPCHRTITSGANRGKEREIASTTAGMHSWDRRGRKKQILYLPTVPHGRKMAAKTSIVIGSRSGERANASASNIYVHVTLGFFLSSRTNTIQPRHSNIIRCDKTAASRGFSSICVSLYLTLAFSLPSGQSR